MKFIKRNIAPWAVIILAVTALLWAYIASAPIAAEAPAPQPEHKAAQITEITTPEPPKAVEAPKAASKPKVAAKATTATQGAFKSTLSDKLSPAQQAWVRKLEMCESSGHPTSINPKDLDGTASYGILQFKKSTFDSYARRYGVKVSNFTDPAQQEAVLTAMLLHYTDINWHHQFPDCVSKLGMPPTT